MHCNHCNHSGCALLQVRLYDSAAGKRPQMDLSWGEGRITALGLEPDGEWKPRVPVPQLMPGCASPQRQLTMCSQPLSAAADAPAPRPPSLAPGRRCWVGNGPGQLEVLDLETRRFSGGIKGLAGEQLVFQHVCFVLPLHPEDCLLQ